MASNLNLASDEGPSVPPSPRNALVVLYDSNGDTIDNPAWQTILSDSHQVVLYNSDSHALSVRPHSNAPTVPSHGACPYCNRPLDEEIPPLSYHDSEEAAQPSRAANYFQLLEIANETSSRPPSGLKGSRLRESISSEGEESISGGDFGYVFGPESMAEGYFTAFFKEEYRLGMGANGSVFLCQVSLATIFYISNILTKTISMSLTGTC